VICFGILICAAIALSAIVDIENEVDYEDSGLYMSGAGWLIFVAIMGITLQSAIGIIHVFDISCVNENFVMFSILVSHQSSVTTVYISNFVMQSSVGSIVLQP